MDAVVIVILGLIFCLMSQSAPSELNTVIEEQQAEVASLEVRTNTEFYEDPHAFEVVAHGLNFC